MKREIKFRAWLPELEMMIYGITPYADGMVGIGADDFEEALEQKNPNWKVCDDAVYFVDDEHFDLVMTILPGEDWYWIEADKCEQLQYTGLHDKNGSEIYEGDIVEDQLTRKYQIEYSVDTCAFKLVKDFDSGNMLDKRGKFVLFDAMNLIVIGNIFETPKL